MQRILIAGEGGQGVQLIAEVLAKAVFTSGKNATYIPNFGVEQRGGVSLAFIIIDENEIPFPKFFKADYIVTMSKRSVPRIQSYIKEDTNLFDASEISCIGLPNKVHNMYVLGRLLKLTNAVEAEILLHVLEEKIAAKIEKNPELKELNRRALEEGLKSIS